MDRASYVYILASGLNGTLYVGVTGDLVKRVWQHREGQKTNPRWIDLYAGIAT